MNIGFIMSVFSFLKELVFGSSNKNQKTGISSKFRKWLILILIISSLALNYFTITKIVKLTSAYIVLDKDRRRVVEELKKKESCELTLDTLQDLLLKNNQ